MKVYITGKKENFNIDQISKLENICEIVYLSIDESTNINNYDKESEKILAIDPDYFDWNLSNEFIDQISNIKAICVNSTSYSWLDVDYIKSKGIVVTNIPKYASTSVSEYAVFLMLALARKYPLQFKNNFKCEYNDEMIMNCLENKTAGIIGLGSIGEKIASICNGFGMKVKYWDRTEKDNDYTYTSLEDLFETSDFIFPALISNEKTRQIITDDLINSMNKKSSIVSIVHGDLFNQKRVLEKVKNNEIYGYAFEDNDSTISDYEGNVFVTPAYAWYSKEALDNLKCIWLKNIINFINNDEIDLV